MIADTLSRSAQRLQKRLRLLQVGGIEALGEPVVDGDEEVVGFTRLALALPQASQGDGRA